MIRWLIGTGFMMAGGIFLGTAYRETGRSLGEMFAIFFLLVVGSAIVAARPRAALKSGEWE